MAKTMKTSVWAFMVMALAAMVGLAMTPLATAQQTQNPQQSQMQGQNQQPVTATGCLQKASNGEGYQLTDSSTMKTYTLTAASSSVDLSAHVGHTVTVTGTPTEASASNAANPSNPATNPAENQESQTGQQKPEQLQVTNIQMVSNSCQGGGIL